ncbi:hypothetical protein TWF506_007002 [Arthrobotrys conoides]|uniref:Uncharacterized protein n=1 Tax=Arthrobotrys conoides TaxID=74498 RepID=A0AAN8RVJ0_9PEZI
MSSTDGFEQEGLGQDGPAMADIGGAMRGHKPILEDGMIAQRRNKEIVECYMVSIDGL